MNPHDQNGPLQEPIREAHLMHGRLFATLLFGFCCFVVGYFLGDGNATAMYETGRKDARLECRPQPKAFKDMTHKQQVRAIRWSMRDRGVIQ